MNKSNATSDDKRQILHYFLCDLVEADRLDLFETLLEGIDLDYAAPHPFDGYDSHVATFLGCIVDDIGIESDYIPSRSRPLLDFAALRGSRAAAQLLLDRGASPNVLNRHNETPLHQAVGRGDLGMARLLLDAGANQILCNSQERAPVHLAAAANNLPMVQLLAARGADLAVKDISDKSPLDHLCSKHPQDFDPAIAQLLLAAGCNVPANLPAETKNKLEQLK